MNNSSLIKAEDLHLSNKTLMEMLISLVNEYVQCIEQLGNNLLSHYNVLSHSNLLFGQTVPFATTCHDIW